MSSKKIPPIQGIDNVREDAALEIGGQSPRLFVRDAVNVNFTETGRIELRQDMQLVTAQGLRDIWQSPLHNDCFAALNNQWVRVDPITWESELLVECGPGPLFHIVLNNQVCMACDEGVFVFDGNQARKLTIDTPAKPMANTMKGGSLTEGGYSFAIAWLIDGMESALSEIETLQLDHNSAVRLQFPMCLDQNVTQLRLYMSNPGGAELHQVADFPISSTDTELFTLPDLGRVAAFQYLSPIKTGAFLKLWRGRLLIARSNVLYFSEAMAYHLTDERYNFIQFPQRIRFVEPVEGGVWIGQADHVVFLRGQDMRSMVLEHKAARAPVYGSSQLLHSDVVGGELSQGGGWCAAWLAENGFVLGTGSGQLVELQAKSIQEITAQSGQLVRFGERVIAVVS